jgi:SAM-dependent methyltransferase
MTAEKMTTSTTSRRRFYNATGRRYEAGRYGDPHMDRYRAFRNETLLAILRDAFGDAKLRILEVGCGTGLTLEFLATHTAGHSLFGLDASDTMLRQAAEKGASLSNRPKLVISDAARLPYADGFFDVVFATRFIHQFEHRLKRELWQEFQRVTRPDGLVILEFYARPYHWVRYHLGARKGRTREDYFRHYPSKAEVRDVAGRGFAVYPLRLAGARVFAAVPGERLGGLATQVVGRWFGGLLLDEYFVVSRQR